MWRPSFPVPSLRNVVSFDLPASCAYVSLFDLLGPKPNHTPRSAALWGKEAAGG